MTDHYVSMAQIRASKKPKNPPPSLQEVFGEDPYSEITFPIPEEETVVDGDTPSCSGASSSGQSSQSLEPASYEAYMPATRKVVLQPGQSGLGMSVAGGVMSSMGLLPVFVTDIDPGGLVERSEGVKVGDRIVRVNGESMEGMSHRDVVLAIKGAGNSLILEVNQCPEDILKHVSVDE